MAEPTTTKVEAQPQEEIDLSDDQIQQLLLEAEGRLRGSDVQLAQGSDPTSFRYLYLVLLLLFGSMKLTEVESHSCLPGPRSNLTFARAMALQLSTRPS